MAKILPCTFLMRAVHMAEIDSIARAGGPDQ
jgi:hypothetical protein